MLANSVSSLLFVSTTFLVSASARSIVVVTPSSFSVNILRFWMTSLPGCSPRSENIYIPTKKQTTTTAAAADAYSRVLEIFLNMSAFGDADFSCDFSNARKVSLRTLLSISALVVSLKSFIKFSTCFNDFILSSHHLIRTAVYIIRSGTAREWCSSRHPVNWLIL